MKRNYLWTNILGKVSSLGSYIEKKTKAERKKKLKKLEDLEQKIKINLNASLTLREKFRFLISQFRKNSINYSLLGQKTSV